MYIYAMDMYVDNQDITGVGLAMYGVYELIYTCMFESLAHSCCNQSASQPVQGTEPEVRVLLSRRPNPRSICICGPSYSSTSYV